MAVATAMIVHLVSADAALRDACAQVLHDCGYRVECCADADIYRVTELPFALTGCGAHSPSGRPFALMRSAQRPACLVLDLDLPAVGAFDLQRAANDLRPRIPVVCIATHARVASAVRAMKASAIDVLCMPMELQQLADRVAHATARGRGWQQEDEARVRARQLAGRLTPREQAVLDLILEGKPNKVIAAHLGSPERTVKVHRHRMMRKLEVRSLAALLQFASTLAAELPAR